MANLDRLIKNLNYNDNIRRTLSAIEDKFGYLNSNSPIPNQAFDTQINELNQASCLYFSERAYHNLQFIETLMKDQALLRRDNNWEDRPIPFVCQGYKDSDNNYYINYVYVPMYDILMDKKIPEKHIRYLMMSSNDRTLIADTQLWATSHLYDYLRDPKPVNNVDYVSRFALLGYTRPPFSKSDVNTCMKLGELSKSTLPGDVAFKQPVISGTILLTTQGLECAIIEYEKNNKNKVAPINLLNITRAEIAHDGGSTQVLPISKTSQPLNGLPTPTFC